MEGKKYLKEERVGKWHIVLDKHWVVPVIKVLNSETGKEHYRLELSANWEWKSMLTRNFNQVVAMVKNWRQDLSY